MAFENIKVEKKNKIAYVTIDRPTVLNALNAATMGELQEVFTENTGLCISLRASA